MNERIWLSSPHMGNQEQKYVNEAFETNWIAPLGPNVTKFENTLENYLGNSKKVAALNSGTSALHLALILAGVTKGDEVLSQSFTFSGSVNPVIYLGAIPIFVDSERETWNMCPELLETAIKARLKVGVKPKAIVVVHSHGMPYKVDEMDVISKKYNIPVIEDAASAFGSEVNGKKCGTFGDFSVLSFNGNKIITTSCGGALVVKTEEEKKNAIFLATQARDDAPHYQHSHIGYNYRMSNVLAGIGRGQMEVIDSRVNARRKNFEVYKNALSDTGIYFLNEPPKFKSNRWLTSVLTNSFEQREKIRVSLESKNIETRPLWKPMHLQPIFKNCLHFTNGVSETLFQKGLCLPSGSNLTDENIVKVIEEIKKAI
jgi:dTDP-4-amino-4,6-dideoxygalactose transaminase